MNPSELVLTPSGLPYHTHLGGEHLADDVVLMGDPGRIDMFKHVFERIEYETQNREMRVLTGFYHDHRFTAMSTGMGCDNIDIVMTELDVAANINITTGQPMPVLRKLNMVRLGTCGAMHGDLACGSYVASTHAIGMDGLLNYYSHDTALFEPRLAQAFADHLALDRRFAQPYAVPAGSALLDRLASDLPQGITVTAPGFYAPQGRTIRIVPTLPDLEQRLASFEWEGLRINNLEMETSGIYGMAKVMGHEALTICLVIANRAEGTFLSTYQNEMNQLVGRTLELLSIEKR